MDNCICNLKNHEEKLINEGAWINLYIEREFDQHFIVALSNGRVVMRIHYCPMCGRKL